jgi:hypothetical protein
VVGEIACDWKEMEGRLARAKRISAMLLVVGLMMEFWEAAKSDNEVADTKERTALVESNNLVLRSNIMALELKFKPREITQAQHDNFVKILEKAPKNPVWILCHHPSREAEAFISQVRKMLNDAGYAANGDKNSLGNPVMTGWSGDGVFDSESIKMSFNSSDSIAIMFNSSDFPDKLSPYGIALGEAFNKISINVISAGGDENLVKRGQAAVVIFSKSGL